LAGENFLRHAQLQKPHDLVRQQVSRETQRATSRTLPALITGVKVLPAQFLNLAQDFAAQPSRRQPNRCPKGVDVAKVMEAIRTIQLREGRGALQVFLPPAELVAEVPQLATVSAFRKLSL
jgi:hypothetical protein